MPSRKVSVTRAKNGIKSRGNRVFSSRVRRGKNKDEAIAGVVVGKDNRRNKTRVKPRGSNSNISAVNSIDSGVYGRSVVVTRSNSRRGGRSVSVTSVSRISSSEDDTRLTQSYEDTTTNITGCTDNDSSNFNQEPPEDPPEEPAPEEPPAPPSNSPINPEPIPEPEPTPNGCLPTDEDQWYNATGPGAEFCPAGTTYKGFAEIPAGVFMVLCGGPGRPAGEGCPEQPIGYSCVDGSCTEVSGGSFATIEECQSSCEPLGYSCSNGECIAVPLSTATYATQAECQANCSIEPPITYDCINGLCVETLNGPYATLSACTDQGCNSPIPPFSTPGSCPNVLYDVTYDITETVNIIGTVNVVTRTATITGPVGGMFVVLNDPDNSGRHSVYITAGSPSEDRVILDYPSTGFTNIPSDPTIIEIVRADGQPDVC